MIQTISSKPLRLLYEKGDASKLPTSHVGKIEMILGLLDSATGPDDMNFPGSRLHQLSGRLKGFWSVSVSGNYRVIFRFEKNEVYDVDYLDYH